MTFCIKKFAEVSDVDTDESAEALYGYSMSPSTTLRHPWERPRSSGYVHAPRLTVLPPQRDRSTQRRVFLLGRSHDQQEQEWTTVHNTKEFCLVAGLPDELAAPVL